VKDLSEMTQDEKRELNRVLAVWLSREKSIGVELNAIHTLITATGAELDTTYTLIAGGDNERE
jgi:hypothetical protein